MHRDKVYSDNQGQAFKRDELLHSLNYSGKFSLEQLDLAEAIADSQHIGLLLVEDVEKMCVTITINSDTQIRSYLDEEEIPPLLLGYQVLNSFISNLSASGYSYLQADLSALGVLFINGVMGQSQHLQELRNLLHGDETKKG